MARSLRASTAAAAKKILVQAEDHDDVEDIGPKGRARSTATASTSRNSASHKRKRVEESPEYEDEAANEESGGDEEEEIEYDDDDDDDESFDAKKVNRRGQGTAAKNGPARAATTTTTATSSSTGPPPAKKRKAPRKSSAQGFALERRLFGLSGQKFSQGEIPPPCCPPERTHTIDYHRPLLLDGDAGRKARRALLAWYDGVQATRGMPWRRDTWLHPDAGLADDATEDTRNELARRAYEVWMSEVMAQQTRIPVVIAYWTRWMARWPTLPDLAAAEAHEVFQEWSGLGYYSRASRVHEAAKLVASDSVFRGLLPPDAATLEARVPGVGRYTAGAISAIVFGRPAAMVDGNVIRVLSRQLGLFADSKAEKELVDLLWAAAEALVQAVARDGDKEGDGAEGDERQEEAPISDRPGRWGQALMELGSTVCAPKPDCAACPISSTCRVFAEGLLLHERDKKAAAGLHTDIDEKRDACDLCEQFPELDEEEAAALAKADKRDQAKENKEKKEKKDTKNKQDDKKAPSVTRSPFFDVEDAAASLKLSEDVLASIVGHARTFPLRRPKKPVREVETLVCAVRVAKGKKSGGDFYLLHQRPAKGLLANLWQLPSYDMPSVVDGAAARRKEAEAFVARWLGDDNGESKKKNGPLMTTLKTKSVKHLGSIPWLFSHLKQTMHVYLFDMAADHDACSVATLPTPASCCWASVAEADKTYTMGTGMRKCWDLVKDV
ncbi:hypothetical protein SBRCBS47491_001578 [Sporothrix bragantina]|uniref:Adenine DNA glycosylase n=1 Tax=Sporothrix bragantina TaxID=671064 RepID=A0ABP0AZQ8_9PEZI